MCQRRRADAKQWEHPASFTRGAVTEVPHILHHAGVLSLSSTLSPWFYYTYIITWPKYQGEIAFILGKKHVSEVRWCSSTTVPHGQLLILVASACSREQCWNTVGERGKCWQCCLDKWVHRLIPRINREVRIQSHKISDYSSWVISGRQWRETYLGMWLRVDHNFCLRKPEQQKSLFNCFQFWIHYFWA